MRRSLLLLLLILVGTTALVQAQSRDRSTAIDESLLPPDMIDGEWTPPFELEQVEWEELPPNVIAAAGADHCVDAPLLAFPDGTVGGGDVLPTNNMTTDPTDPDISECMFGAPPSVQGFRSVWYRFFPLQSGVIDIQTTLDPSNFETSYDTVVALYRSDAPFGECNNLTLIACNDDAQGFQSRIKMFVRQWDNYYIEVVDWNFAVNNEAVLGISVSFDVGETLWDVQEQASMSWQKPRSRHAVVAIGDYIYVIAGQTSVTGFPTRDGAVDRYHAPTGTWAPMMPMVGAGYSNTTAAVVNGRIYIPAGYVGNNSAYDGTHWVFDPNLPNVPYNGAWFANQNPVPWNLLDGQPYAWSQAVSMRVGQTDGYFLTGGVLPVDAQPQSEPVAHLLFFAPSADGHTGVWNTQLAPMSIARYAHVAAAVTRQTAFGTEQQVCVAGGITKESNIYRSLSDAECYSNISGQWSPIAALTFNRFNGSSAVGPDGRWYVFGGTTVISLNGSNTSLPLTVTEVYDPETNTWQVLDSRYDLRAPARDWARGAFVGNTIHVFGGETFNVATSTWGVVPLVESLYIPPTGQILPAVRMERVDGYEPNDTLETATPIGLNDPRNDSFVLNDDWHDFFAFHVPYNMVVRASVTEIPYGSDYDLYLYNSDKFLVGYSNSIGNQDEHATSFLLTPGLYYALVQRITTFVAQSPYRIVITPQ